MNKKGFTLIELLATIVVIAIVAVISGFVMTKVIDKTQKKSYEVTYNEISSNANNYLSERNDLFFVTKNDNTEYQCITVQNLIDYGYLKDSITQSKIADNITVKKDGYIYIERDKEVSAVLKVLYIGDDDDAHDCNRAMKAMGDIYFTVSPIGWSKTKSVVITYLLKNINNLGEYDDKYKYDYQYYDKNNDPLSDIFLIADINKNDYFNGIKTNPIEVSKNGKMFAHIIHGGNNIASGDKIIEKIDYLGPVVNSKYSGPTTVKKTVLVPLEVKDVADEYGSLSIGVNYDTFSAEDLEITIGGSIITDYFITHENAENYNLTVNDYSHSGELVITIEAGKIFDKLDNGNLKINLKTGIMFDNTYTVSFNSNGGSTPTPTLKKVSYGSSYGNLPTTSRGNYTFNGWYTAATGGTKVNDSTVFTLLEDQVLYAQWTYSPPPSSPSSGSGNDKKCPAGQYYDYGLGYCTTPQPKTEVKNEPSKKESKKDTCSGTACKCSPSCATCGGMLCMRPPGKTPKGKG